MQDNHHNYIKGDLFDIIRQLAGDGLFTSEGELWLRQRRLMQPAFHRSRIAGFGEIMTGRTLDMLAQWERRADPGQPLDVAEEMTGLTMAIISETMFGARLEADTRAIGQAIDLLSADINFRFQIPFYPSLRWPTLRNRRALAAMRTVDDVVLGIVDQRRRGGEERDDLLGMLMEARDEETGQGMAGKQLRDEVVTIFVAGHETTAVLLTWAFCLLMLSLVSLLVLWLVSLPEYFTRVTTLTVETYSQAGEVIASNELVQAQAEARGLSLPLYALYEVALSGLLMAPFWLVAALILWRAQGGWFGWYTALILAGLGAVNVQEVFYVTQPPGLVLVLVDLVSWVVWPAMFVWFFLFPGGGATPRWAWRLVAAMQVFFLALSARAFLAASGVLAPDPANLQLVLGVPIALATVALVLYAQGYRYRRVYSAVEKQQVKWFVFGMALLVIELAIFALAPPDDVGLYVQDLFGLVLLVIPVSIGIAILRYRLWDIDVIIRKTLVYTVLTVLLALVYFGIVVLLQALFGRLAGVGQSTLAVVISTLAIAALFTPLRRRIQDAIDRRFFRKKYNAQQVLAQFAKTARDETDLDALTAKLVRVVQETLQPERVSVVLFNRGSDQGRR